MPVPKLFTANELGDGPLPFSLSCGDDFSLDCSCGTLGMRSGTFGVATGTAPDGLGCPEVGGGCGFLRWW